MLIVKAEPIGECEVGEGGERNIFAKMTDMMQEMMQRKQTTDVALALYIYITYMTEYGSYYKLQQTEVSWLSHL
jgi:hypothetical protein